MTRGGCVRGSNDESISKGAREVNLGNALWFSKQKNRPWGRFFLRLIKPERDFGRSDWIRTSDLLVPNETRYQAALRSEDGAHFT